MVVLSPVCLNVSGSHDFHPLCSLGLKKDRPARSKVLVPDPAKKHQRISDVVYDENKIDMGKYKTGNDIPKNQGKCTPYTQVH